MATFHALTLFWFVQNYMVKDRWDDIVRFRDLRDQAQASRLQERRLLFLRSSPFKELAVG